MYITYNKLQEPYGEKLDQLFQRKNCLIEVNPGRVLLPEKFKEIGEQIRALKIRKSDVWLISYPRTGMKKEHLIKVKIFFYSGHIVDLQLLIKTIKKSIELCHF